MATDKISSVAFPDVVTANSVEEKDLSFKSSAGADVTGLAIVYPKTFGNCRLTLELAGIKVIDDVPLAAIGVAYDGDPSYASRPMRYKLDGNFSIKIRLQNTENSSLPAGSVSVVFYEHQRIKGVS